MSGKLFRHSPLPTPWAFAVVGGDGGDPLDDDNGGDDHELVMIAPWWKDIFVDIPSQSLQLMTSPSSIDGEKKNGDVFYPQFYRRNYHDDDDGDDIYIMMQCLSVTKNDHFHYIFF